MNFFTSPYLGEESGVERWTFYVTSLTIESSTSPVSFEF